MATPVSNRDFLSPAEACADQFGTGFLFVGWQENSRADVRYVKEKGFKAMAWNLEPLFFANHYLLLDFMLNADECYDYSPLNLNLLKLYGINAQFKMVAPNKAFYDQKNKDIDVLFIGTKSERRTKALSQIDGVTWVTDAHGQDYWDLCARAKVILNIKNDPINPQESVRISPLLASGSCVVSEVSQINHYGNGLLEWHQFNQVDVIKYAFKNWQDIAKDQQEKYYERCTSGNWTA